MENSTATHDGRGVDHSDHLQLLASKRGSLSSQLPLSGEWRRPGDSPQRRPQLRRLSTKRLEGALADVVLRVDDGHAHSLVTLHLSKSFFLLLSHVFFLYFGPRDSRRSVQVQLHVSELLARSFSRLLLHIAVVEVETRERSRRLQRDLARHSSHSQFQPRVPRRTRRPRRVHGPEGGHHSREQP